MGLSLEVLNEIRRVSGKGDACVECRGEGCNRCDGTGDEPLTEVEKLREEIAKLEAENRRLHELLGLVRR